jgi:hypothetical protein
MACTGHVPQCNDFHDIHNGNVDLGNEHVDFAQWVPGF